jgi:hypothetical protein
MKKNIKINVTDEIYNGVKNLNLPGSLNDAVEQVIIQVLVPLFNFDAKYRFMQFVDRVEKQSNHTYNLHRPKTKILLIDNKLKLGLDKLRSELSLNEMACVVLIKGLYIMEMADEGWYELEEIYRKNDNDK